MIVNSLGVFAQRDTTIVAEVTFTTDSTVFKDTSEVWSNDMGQYVHYSRIDMGYRMNISLDYSKKANRQFWSGIGLIALSSAGYMTAAYSDPVIYVEYSNKYSQDYFNASKHSRNAKIVASTMVLSFGAYLLWSSHINNAKSRWAISPNGIKYNLN